MTQGSACNRNEVGLGTENKRNVLAKTIRTHHIRNKGPKLQPFEYMCSITISAFGWKHQIYSSDRFQNLCQNSTFLLYIFT